MAPANQTKEKGQFMDFSQGHSGTKVQYESCLFSKGKNTRIHRKMGEIHELFVLALSLVWFAGATPEFRGPLASHDSNPYPPYPPYPNLEGREPPLTLRRENQYLYFGRFFPCTPGPFSCSTGLFVYHFHGAGPVPQEFGLVLRVGVRHSTSVLRPLPWG